MREGVEEEERWSRPEERIGVARCDGSLCEQGDAFFPHSLWPARHRDVVRSHVAPKTAKRDCGFEMMLVTGELRLVTTIRTNRESKN